MIFAAEVPRIDCPMPEHITACGPDTDGLVGDVSSYPSVSPSNDQSRFMLAVNVGAELSIT